MSAVIILPNLAILGHKISKNFPNGIIDQQPGLFAIGPYSVVQRSMTLPNGLVEGSTTEWPNLTASPELVTKFCPERVYRCRVV